MDAIDPRIDYLLIDDLMLSHQIGDVVEYCSKLGCNIDEVLNLWFDASSPDGLMIESWYFENFKINLISEPIELSYKSSALAIPSKKRMQMEARSYSMGFYDTKLTRSTDVYKLRIKSRCHEGMGWVQSINHDFEITHHGETMYTDVGMEVDWWKKIK